MLQSTAMGKAETLTLSLEFPEGQESPDTAGTTKTLRLKIFRASGRLFDQKECELPISTGVINKVSAVFTGSSFYLERVGDRFLIKKREAQRPVETVTDGKSVPSPDEDREEPDYCAHFRNGEWGKFSESTDGAVKLATRINAPKKDGSTPKWRVRFDRNKRVFQYRGEELPLFSDGEEVDEKTLRVWMKRANGKRRSQKQRAAPRLAEDPTW